MIRLFAILLLFALDAHADGLFADATLGVSQKQQMSSLGLGYRYHNLFVEYIHPSFQDKVDNYGFRDDGPCPLGCGIGTTIDKRQLTTTKTQALLLGYRFDMGVSLFSGVHKYDEQTQGKYRIVQWYQSSGEAIIDRTDWLNSSKTGYAALYGASYDMPIIKHLSAVARITRYAGLDRATVEAGLRGEW